MAAVVKLGGIKPQTFELLPAGSYRMVVQEADVVTAQSSGNEMLKLTLSVSPDDEENANRKVWDQIVLTENSYQFLVNFLAALGYTQEELAAIEVIDADFAANLEEREVGVRVGIKTDPQYPDKNVVKGYFAV